MNINNDMPSIDMEIYNDLLSILQDDFHEILNDFINDTPAQLIKLKSALEQANFKEIFSISHAQSGASGNIGLAKFHHLSNILCVQAKDRDIKNCTELANALFANFEECKILLTEKLNNRL